MASSRLPAAVGGNPLPEGSRHPLGEVGVALLLANCLLPLHNSPCQRYGCQLLHVVVFDAQISLTVHQASAGCVVAADGCFRTRSATQML